MKFWLPFILTVAFYFSGAFFIKQPDIEKLKNMGIAHQEEYTYVDRYGEEHDDETLIEIKGIGGILTYKDIYGAAVALIVPSMFVGWLIFGSNGERTPSSKDSLKHIMFADCILGLLLIWLTSKENIPSTILYWLGIISAGFWAYYND